MDIDIYLYIDIILRYIFSTLNFLNRSAGKLTRFQDQPAVKNDLSGLLAVVLVFSAKKR